MNPPLVPFQKYQTLMEISFVQLTKMKKLNLVNWGMIVYLSSIMQLKKCKHNAGSNCDYELAKILQPKIIQAKL